MIVCRLAVWQVERLARFGKPVMIFVDEPILAIHLRGAERNFLRRVLDSVRHAGALAGIHCCALGAAPSVFAAAPDVISFDAYHELEPYMAAAHATGFIEEGGILALGLIPTIADPFVVTPEALLARWMSTVQDMGLSPNRLLAHTVITATCGLGLVDENAARGSFLQAQRLARRLAPLQEMAGI